MKPKLVKYDIFIRFTARNKLNTPTASNRACELTVLTINLLLVKSGKEKKIELNCIAAKMDLFCLC